MRKFGLIGFPLGHSFSKKFFTEKFEQEAINAQYDLYELPGIAAFEPLKDMDDLCGLNVTIPYKQQVIPYLQELDETAAEIGAVNVIKFIRKDGQLTLKGYNTDAIGFEEGIKPLLKFVHTKALILGTGGASKAVDYVLKKNGLQTTFVSRTEVEGCFTYEQLSADILAEYKVIVNASPVGTYPKEDACPAIPYEFLTEDHLLYDLVYNPAETLFLKRGKERGAAVLNGESMLTGQAIAAWKVWNE
jgi:shikimate dehydrogenase